MYQTTLAKSSKTVTEVKTSLSREGKRRVRVFECVDKFILYSGGSREMLLCCLLAKGAVLVVGNMQQLVR